MRIIITGKSGAGKTELAQELLKLLSATRIKSQMQLPKNGGGKQVEYRAIQIDELRKHYNYMCTLGGEQASYNQFVKFVRQNPYSIVECTGYSYRYPELFYRSWNADELNPNVLDTSFIIELHTSRNQGRCFQNRLHRLQERTYIDKPAPVPFPREYNTGLQGLEQYENVHEKMYFDAIKNGMGGSTFAHKYEQCVNYYYNTDYTIIKDLAGQVLRDFIQARQMLLKQITLQMSSCAKDTSNKLLGLEIKILKAGNELRQKKCELQELGGKSNTGIEHKAIKTEIARLNSRLKNIQSQYEGIASRWCTKKLCLCKIR